jgi:integrase
VATYRSHYNSSLREAFGDMEVRRITTPVIQRWVTQQVRKGTRPGTLRAYYRTLATCLGGRKGSSAVRDGLRPTTPCEGIELPEVAPREIQSYSVDEIDRLMEAIPTWWHTLVMVAADSGLRWGELMGLNVADAQGGRLVVNKAMIQLTKKETTTGTPFELKPYPKSGKARHVAISPEVAALVEAMVKERRLFPADRLFSMPDKDARVDRTPEWPTGRPVSRSYFRQKVWRPAHQALGMEPLHFHDVRGSHITWLLGGQADLATIMQRVGHASLSTTQVYVRAQRDADERALNALALTRHLHRHG